MSSTNADMLDMLPEEIISRILSLMPTKFAVRTSILSKRWKNKWMFVTNLDFDDFLSIHAIDSLIKFVDRLLKFRQSSQLNLLRLHFPRRLISESTILNWINETIKLNVHELDIDVVHLDEFPKSMFICKTLTKLRLDHYLCGNIFWRSKFPINLPCLKNLDIVVFNNPSVNAFKIISGSPMLESLFLKVSSSGKEDYIFNIPTLKRLKITLPCPSVSNKFVLNVPNLEYLFVGGFLYSSFVMKNVSSLVEVFASIHKITNDHMWAKLLRGVSGVKSLSVNNIPSELPLPFFPNMRHLELKGSWNSLQILQFLRSCPELKHLCIETLVSIHWIGLKVDPVCMLTNLATIKFSLFKGWKCDIKFLEYMLMNSKVLKKITITLDTSKIEDEACLCAKLIELPRFSNNCEIHFHRKRAQSTGN